MYVSGKMSQKGNVFWRDSNRKPSTTFPLLSNNSNRRTQNQVIYLPKISSAKQTPKKKFLAFAQENNSPSLNSIKRLLAIIMIYKVTSQTDLQRQPERNPTQIQLPFT